jgi:hypothetical protein
VPRVLSYAVHLPDSGFAFNGQISISHDQINFHPRTRAPEGHGQIFLRVAQVGAYFFNKHVLECSTKLFTAALYDPHPRERSHNTRRVLFSQDADLLIIADRWLQTGCEFAGLVYAHQLAITIGQAVRDLTLLAQALDPEDMHNHADEDRTGEPENRRREQAFFSAVRRFSPSPILRFFFSGLRFSDSER